MNYSAAYPQSSLLLEPKFPFVDSSNFNQSTLVGGSRRKTRKNRKIKKHKSTSHHKKTTKRRSQHRCRRR